MDNIQGKGVLLGSIVQWSVGGQLSVTVLVVGELGAGDCAGDCAGADAGGGAGVVIILQLIEQRRCRETRRCSAELKFPQRICNGNCNGWL